MGKVAYWFLRIAWLSDEAESDSNSQVLDLLGCNRDVA